MNKSDFLYSSLAIHGEDAPSDIRRHRVFAKLRFVVVQSKLNAATITKERRRHQIESQPQAGKTKRKCRTPRSRFQNTGRSSHQGLTSPLQATPLNAPRMREAGFIRHILRGEPDRGRSIQTSINAHHRHHEEKTHASAVALAAVPIDSRKGNARAGWWRFRDSERETSKTRRKRHSEGATGILKRNQKR